MTADPAHSTALLQQYRTALAAADNGVDVVRLSLALWRVRPEMTVADYALARTWYAAAIRKLKEGRT